MLPQRFTSAIILTMLCALLIPQLALATKDVDKTMTNTVLSQAEKYGDSFEDIAKAWKKAAPGSPEADSLAKKGSEAYSALEAYVSQQLNEFETRRAWYAAQGGEYNEGRDFMAMRAKRLQKMLDSAQKLDLYKHLKP